MTHNDSSLPAVMTKGSNVSLAALGAELGSVTILLDSQGRDGVDLAADVSVMLLDGTGRVRTSDDFVFYNQPIAAAGAVHLRDKVTVSPEETAPDHSTEGSARTSDVVTLELDDLPEEIQRIVISASLDPGLGLTFGDASEIQMRVQRTDDAEDILRYEITDATSELALVFGEFYRRNGEWKVRAVGQGYADGLGALVTAHGVEVAADAADGSDAQGAAQVEPTGPTEDQPAPTGNPLPAPSTSGSEASSPGSPRRPISVRRPARAPRLPADWNASIPTGDGNDWQAARLFPVAGIGAGEEQERRATSAFLAVLGMVREFGADLTTRFGAPRGPLSAYVEVPFGQDEEAYRPDGVIEVTRGGTTWTALVEVKTSTGRLDANQIDRYVDIARTRGYNAVITISNELTGGDADHPVMIDKRKLRKVSLHHLSWDEVRAAAILLARHRGIADPTQRLVLEEFIRYIEHPRSGMGGMGDMGSNWVKVREAVKAKTARPADKSTRDISARYDELIQHLGHHLTALLGVEVQALAPRDTPDHASRSQQLADSGLLFGRLKVPGAIDTIVVSADLRSDKVSASLTFPAPRGDTRQQTRINWLLRQLPDGAHDSIRIEANYSGPRGGSTASLLGKTRQDPSVLLPPEQREIRSFTLSMEMPMGAKRAAGTGTLITSVKTVTTVFYADVVQNVRPWTDRRS